MGPWARPPVLLPVLRQARHSPFSSFTPPVLSPARSKVSKATAPPHRSWRSSRQQHSAPGSAAQELRVSGAPGASATSNSFGNPLQATSPLPHSSRNQFACLQRKNQQHTPNGTKEQRKTDATKKHHFPSSEDIADASNQPHSWVGQPTLVGGRCDCLARFARFTKRATPGPALLAACGCSPGHLSSICSRSRLTQTTAPFRSEINNSTLLPLRQRLVALRLFLGDIALRAVPPRSRDHPAGSSSRWSSSASRLAPSPRPHPARGSS